MSDHLTATIASSLAMSYGSHIHPPQGGKEWKAAEDLRPIIDAEIRKARVEALKDAAEALSRQPSTCKSPGCHRADQIILESRADQIEEDQ